jgi:hypothetical protein
MTMEPDVEARDVPQQVRFALFRWENEGGAISAASVLAARALGFDVPGFAAEAAATAKRHDTEILTPALLARS